VDVDDWFEEEGAESDGPVECGSLLFSLRDMTLLLDGVCPCGPPEVAL
jgi:hypothetical protein